MPQSPVHELPRAYSEGLRRRWVRRPHEPRSDESPAGIGASTLTLSRHTRLVLAFCRSPNARAHERNGDKPRLAREHDRSVASTTSCHHSVVSGWLNLREVLGTPACSWCVDRRGAELSTWRTLLEWRRPPHAARRRDVPEYLSSRQVRSEPGSGTCLAQDGRSTGATPDRQDREPGL